MYLDKDPKEKFVQYIFREKCDTCKFKNFDKNQVKLYEVMEQRLMICFKCDKFPEYRQVLVTDLVSREK